VLTSSRPHQFFPGCCCPTKILPRQNHPVSAHFVFSTLLSIDKNNAGSVYVKLFFMLKNRSKKTTRWIADET
jgi:hypothetical protein